MIDMTSHMLYRVENLNVENERISYQMSTGKILQDGSDDSVLYAKMLDIEDNLRVYEGLQVQIEKTTAQNIVSDSSMDEMKQSIDLIKVDLLKSLNAGMDDSSRGALATNISGLRDNLYTIANTRVDGEYLFTGSDTTKQSFVKDADFEANGKVSFGGDAILRKIAVEPNTYRQRGITGYDALMYNASTAGNGEQLDFFESERIIDDNGNEWKFIDHDDADGDGDITTGIDKDRVYRFDKNGDVTSEYIAVTNDGETPAKYTTGTVQISNVDGVVTTTSTRFLEAKHNYFDDLNVMINALNGYDTNIDGTKGDAISTGKMDEILSLSLEQTSKQYDASNIGHAELGGRNNIFNIALERIDAKTVHYNILMQETGGADMSKLAMESKSLEMTYQALYSTVAKMHELSLLNFIN